MVAAPAESIAPVRKAAVSALSGLIRETTLHNRVCQRGGRSSTTFK